MSQLLAEGRVAVFVLASHHGFRYIFVGTILFGVGAEGCLLGSLGLTEPFQINHGVQKISLAGTKCVPGFFIAYIRTLS